MAVGQSFCVQIQYVKLHIYCIHISLGKGSVHLSCVRRQLYTSKRNTVSVSWNITVKFCLLTLPLLMLCLLDAARWLERRLTHSFHYPSRCVQLERIGRWYLPQGRACTLQAYLEQNLPFQNVQRWRSGEGGLRLFCRASARPPRVFPAS